MVMTMMMMEETIFSHHDYGAIIILGTSSVGSGAFICSFLTQKCS